MNRQQRKMLDHHRTPTFGLAHMHIDAQGNIIGCVVAGRWRLRYLFGYPRVLFVFGRGGVVPADGSPRRYLGMVATVATGCALINYYEGGPRHA